jgi:hypothetical protein
MKSNWKRWKREAKRGGTPSVDLRPGPVHVGDVGSFHRGGLNPVLYQAWSTQLLGPSSPILGDGNGNPNAWQLSLARVAKKIDTSTQPVPFSTCGTGYGGN